MKILAIEVSANISSVALTDDDKILGEFSVLSNKTHSQTIMPMVDNLFSYADIDLNEIDYIACSKGPGSFTGLRIGASLAKGLAHGLNKKIIPVPTLDAMAYNVCQEGKIIVPAMDARRGQVYTAFFVWEGGVLKKLTVDMAIDLSDTFELLKKYDKQAIFTGNGAIAFKEQILENGFLTAQPHLIGERAASVAAYALCLGQKGEFTDYKEFIPEYLRLSQAEREAQNDNN